MTKLDDPIRHAIIGEGDPSIVRNNDTSSSLQIYPNDKRTPIKFVALKVGSPYQRLMKVSQIIFQEARCVCTSTTIQITPFT